MKKNWKFWAGLIFAIMFVLSVCVLAWNWRNGEYEIYNAVSALFSGLAFIAFISSIYLQSQELKLQRQELADTRKELEGQKEQLRLQNEHFAQQNFETGFFNMLATQRQIVNEIEYKDMLRAKICHGRDFFDMICRDMNILYSELYINKKEVYLKIVLDYDKFKYYTKIKNIDDKFDFSRSGSFRDSFKNYIDNTNFTPREFVSFISEINFNKHNSIIGHYFQHLYNILRYIKYNEERGATLNTNIFVKDRIYVDLLRSQMSEPELVVLFYYAILHRDMKDLVIYFGFFQELADTALLNPCHRDFLC